MHDVKFTSNQYLGQDGGAVFVLLQGNLPGKRNFYFLVKECQFVNNTSPDHGAALFIYTEDFSNGIIRLEDALFNQNIAGSSVIYIMHGSTHCNSYNTYEDNNKLLQVNNSTFINNAASSMYLSACNVSFLGTLLFKNNTADNGGAMYLNQGATVSIYDGANIQFIANTAAQNGGAIYVDLLCKNINYYYGDPKVFPILIHLLYMAPRLLTTRQELLVIQYISMYKGFAQ